MAKKPGRTTKTESVGLRISPRTRHLIEIMTRRQRRSINALVEVAIEALADDFELSVAGETWSTDANERLVSMYRQCPSLLSFDEEIEAKELIRQRGPEPRK